MKAPPPDCPPHSDLDTSPPLFYHADNSILTRHGTRRGGVAQSAERGSHKPYVAGSSPAAATNGYAISPLQLGALSTDTLTPCLFAPTECGAVPEPDRRPDRAPHPRGTAPSKNQSH